MNFDLYNKKSYALSYSLINYAQAAIVAVLTFFLASILSTEEFGNYRFGIACMSIISVIGLYGSDKGLLIELIRKESRASNTLISYSLIRLFVAVASTIALYIWLVATYSDFNSRKIGLIFAFIGILMAMRSPGWFDANQRLRQHASFLLADKVIFSILLLASLLIFHSELDGFYIGLITLCSVALLLMVEYIVVLKNSNISKSAFKNIGSSVMYLIVSYGWVWLMALANLLMTSVGQLLLDSNSNRLALAYLGLALQFANISRLLMQQMVRLNGPKIAQVSTGNISKRETLNVLLKLLTVTLLKGLVMTLAIGVVAYFIITNFFANYQPSIAITWVLLIWTLVLGSGLIVNRFIIGLKLQKITFFSSVFWGIISVALVYTYATAYGALGYASILLVCHAGSVFSQILILYFKFPKRALD